MLAVCPDSESKTSLLIRFTCAAWLVAKTISWKLWLSDRLFPIIPVCDYFPEAGPKIHLLLFVSSVAGLIFLLVLPKNRYVVFGFVAAEVFSCLLDQMRWQPWEFQYLLTFAFILFSKNRKQLLSLMALLLSATYIFSGLHKCNGGFLYNIWDKLVLHRLFGLDWETVGNPVLHYCGLFVALVETGLGLALLFSKRKKPFVVIAVAMHLLILAALSPIGLYQNEVIWPWNILMCFLVFLVFWDEPKAFLKLKNGVNLAALVIIVLLPALSFFGYWDHYLSFNLYSGNVRELYICSDYPELDAYRSRNKKYHFCTSAQISANRWSLTELKVPVYPQQRVFKTLKREWDRQHPQDHAAFYSFGYPYGKENLREIK
jgi:hypothetical protein